MIYPDDLVNKIVAGDCLEVMLDIPGGVIDMVLCDLPYGRTKNKWDKIIQFDRLWQQYHRVCKPSAAIVLTATQPFAAQLIMSNFREFRYDWVWVKNKSTGFLNARKMPLRKHELVLVFYRRLPVYHAQKTSGHTPVHAFTKHTSDGSNYGATALGISGGGSTERHPYSVLEIDVCNNDKERIHPNQKPLALFEYLVNTYTDPGALVLDNCIGSGTTAVACKKTGRNFIGIDLDSDYCEQARKRVGI